MEIDSGDDVLRTLASGGSMDYAQWPDLLPAVIARIHKVATDEFPTPVIPPPRHISPPPEPRLLPPLPSSDPIEPSSANNDSTSSSQENNKENTNPAPPPPTSAPEAQARAASPAADADDAPDKPQGLPPQVVALMDDITASLEASFPRYPPHTIQRLSELVLFPRQHYRSLPAYLHALDRVVHVTSGANIYPLPPAVSDMSAMTRGVKAAGEPWTNGVGGASPLALAASSGLNVGSDEALGGALLTPIPWLQPRRASSGSPPVASSAGSDGVAAATQEQTTNPAQESQQQQGRQVRTESTETIDGPNGVGHIETVSISLNGIPSHSAVAALQQQQQQLAQQQAARGVTQGELLRQEQRAGVIPVNQLRGSVAVPMLDDGTLEHIIEGEMGSSTGPESNASDDEHIPHARGPEEIGAADTGPQAGDMASLAGHGPPAIEMHAIDVAAAVGRRPAPASSEGSPPRQQIQLPLQESGGGGAKAAPADEEPSEQELEEQERRLRRGSTPKREAEEILEQALLKKPKGSDHEGGGDGADGEAVELKKDAEGDVVIADDPKVDEAGLGVDAADIKVVAVESTTSDEA